MLSISELPRKDGIVVGQFLARHRSESFAAEGYGFKFRDGVTIAPVAQRVHERLHAAWGSDVTFEPADVESAEAAFRWLEDRAAPPARLEELALAFHRKFVGEPEPLKQESEPVLMDGALREHPGHPDVAVPSATGVLLNLSDPAAPRPVGSLPDNTKEEPVGAASKAEAPTGSHDARSSKHGKSGKK